MWNLRNRLRFLEECQTEPTYSMLLSATCTASHADSPAIVHRCDAVYFLEGIVEIGRMVEAAAFGDVLDGQSVVGFQQVACPQHLYLQHV